MNYKLDVTDRTIFIKKGFCIFLLQDDWRMTAIITTCLPVISLVIIYFVMPESPTWLVAHDKIEAAKKSISRIRLISINSPEIKEEIDQLIANKMKNIDTETEGLSFQKKLLKKIKYFKQPMCWKPFLIMVVFFYFQQAAGTFVIIFYAVNIIQEAGVTIDPFLATIVLGASRIVGASVLGMLCRRFGRRPPTIASGSLMTVFMLTLAAYLFAVHLEAVDSSVIDKLSWLPVTLVILYFFTSTCGYLTIPFAMIAEIFPTRIRGLAGGLTSCLGYIFNFIFVKTYPLMVETMGKDGVFCFYGCMILVGTIFVVLFLPETKGKTLQEIEDHFREGGSAVRPERTRLMDKEKV